MKSSNCLFCQTNCPKPKSFKGYKTEKKPTKNRECLAFSLDKCLKKLTDNKNCPLKFSITVSWSWGTHKRHIKQGLVEIEAAEEEKSWRLRLWYGSSSKSNGCLVSHNATQLSSQSNCDAIIGVISSSFGNLRQRHRRHTVFTGWVVLTLQLSQGYCILQPLSLTLNNKKTEPKVPL